MSSRRPAPLVTGLVLVAATTAPRVAAAQGAEAAEAPEAAQTTQAAHGQGADLSLSPTPATDDRRVFALGTTFAKGYGLLGVVSRLRPFDRVVTELGVGLRPWIIEISGCGSNDIDEGGVETMLRGSVAFDIAVLRGKHHLGVELGGGFSTQSGPSIDGGAFYEIFFTKTVSMQVVLGGAYWVAKERYNRRFFSNRLNADYDEVMTCAGDAKFNTLTQSWGLLWGLGMNYYLL